MSVFTKVERDELVALLRHYDTGELLDYEGISDGIENTNYFVTTVQREMVLTLFETHSFDEMGYFLDLMAHVAEHGIPSAHPVADRDGHYLRMFKDKPTALVDRLEGTSLDHPTDAQCATLGSTMAKLHLAARSFSDTRSNGRGHDWRMATAEKLLAKLPDQDAQTLRTEMAFQQSNRFDQLPGGVIHADLFRDNVLWSGNDLTGIIDFYYACDDAFLYDLAVAANDWCVEADGAFVDSRFKALLASYHAVRPITQQEANAWPAVVRAAALRFWLSRLYDWHFPRPGEITHRKDPNVFRRIIMQRQKIQAPLTLDS
ncbi:MAG: homoserine kinase [Gammaproteobacteria bacterium]|nr:homoserine kinase [Gammaproteobacteria bacterium]